MRCILLGNDSGTCALSAVRRPAFHHVQLLSPTGQVAQVLGMCAEGQTLRAPGLAFETWENTKLRYAISSFGRVPPVPRLWGPGSHGSLPSRLSYRYSPPSSECEPRPGGRPGSQQAGSITGR